MQKNNRPKLSVFILALFIIAVAFANSAWAGKGGGQSAEEQIRQANAEALARQQAANSNNPNAQ